MIKHLIVAIFLLFSIHAFALEDATAVEMEEIKELAASDRAADRIRAASFIEARSKHSECIDLIKTLIDDKISSVRVAGYRALSAACISGSVESALALELSSNLRKELDEESILQAFKGGQAQVIEITERMACLNTLYFWAVPMPARDFEQWQREQYRGFQFSLIAKPKEQDDIYFQQFIRLMGGVYDVALLRDIADELSKSVDTMSPSQCRNFLIALWHHSLLGEGAPANEFVVIRIQANYSKLQAHCLRDPQDEIEMNEVKRVFELTSKPKK